MVPHQDGFCDRCGCELKQPELTVEGASVCTDCVLMVSFTRKVLAGWVKP